MPKLNEAELAARYGFAMAVINSHPDLRNLFNRAVAETWTPERFQAELRNTSWFQANSENARNYEVLKAADPATFKARLDQVRTRMQMMAAELGALIPAGEVENLANLFFKFGYDDNQIRQTLVKYVQFTDGRMLGQAGQWERELREYAAKMGVRLSDQAIEEQVRNAVAGKQTFQDALSWVQQTAASAMPHLAERFAAGDTLETVADPYKQTMAQLLELNPQQIDVFDPTIRAALTHRDENGNTALRTLYDFENDLRKDPRWLKTKNAQDAAMATTNRVLRDMGLIS